MGDQRNGGITWTEETWNPIRGCSKVSAGCANCYAETMAARFSGEGQPYAGLITDGHWNGAVCLVLEHLEDPLRWKRPRRVFVNSMSDLFHEELSFQEIASIFAVMAAAPQHTFQVLTKRPGRMRAFFEVHEPLPNVWLGVSAEDQTTLRRAWELLKTRAAVRFLSLEPLLGPVDLDELELLCKTWRRGATMGTYLDWVIVGGESGPHARPMHPDWVRTVRDQCAASETPFLFKQWGEWIHHPSCLTFPGCDLHVFPDIGTFHHAGKRIAGRLLDGQIHDAYPAV